MRSEINRRLQRWVRGVSISTAARRHNLQPHVLPALGSKTYNAHHFGNRKLHASRISCIDQEPGIEDFPVLVPESDMENITDIYITNQQRLFTITEDHLKFYSNLRNLTVTNSQLTSVSTMAFFNNSKLQYLNLRDNNLSTLSWMATRNANMSTLLLSGNPLQCACENIWIKTWLDESEREGLQCLQEGGEAEALSGLTLPSCEHPHVEVNPVVVTQMAGSDAIVICNVSGAPPPELSWSLNSSEHPPLITNYEVTLCLPIK
ncbi:hypothetical protein IRJ41_021149 [Triplophysa rosa]|uniref:Ig-like domain-containing protein n=1 Tax=Triplophysa rosa TaxID=992332 RepID=A0A9W8CBN9_TRIRA|nr:hypothetical protein IRJ41_021149 [Triplophysa rosa]